MALVFAHRYTRDTRYFSGVLSGLMAGFVTFVFLEPHFVPVGLDLAMVVLYILSFLSAMVGMSLGVLLPTLFPGICSGLSLALLVGTFFGNVWTLYFPVVGGVLALIGAILSVR
jgi:hypothetical protein